MQPLLPLFRLRATLPQGTSALHSSAAVRVQGGKTFTVAAQMRREGRANARLGVLFGRSGEGGDSAQVTAWARPIEGGGAYQRVEFAGVAPEGYDRARVQLSASGPEGELIEDEDDVAWAEVDDVSLVQGGSAAAAAAFDEFRLHAVHKAGNFVHQPRPIMMKFRFVTAKIDAMYACKGGKAVLREAQDARSPISERLLCVS